MSKSKDFKSAISTYGNELENRWQGGLKRGSGSSYTSDNRKAIMGAEQDIETKLVKIEELREAPEDYNFYPPLSDTKMLELIDSIKRNKLLSPVIVWENANTESKYMILSGHNRVNAFKKLYELTSEEQYLKIPAIIKGGNDFTENNARSIIVDANHQREKDKETIAKEVIIKYTELENDYSFIGNKKEVIAEKLGISTATVMRYKKLSDLIDLIKKLVFNNDISLNNALHLASLNKERQIYLYENYKDDLNSKHIKKVNNDTNESEIDDILHPKQTEWTSINFKIPKEKEDELKEIIEKWMKENNYV